MAAEHSMDIVSKVDRSEVDNAINQAAKETAQRFDFKDTATTIKWAGETIAIESSTEERANAAWDVLQSKLARRGVSLKAVEASPVRVSGKRAHITATLRQGISQENAKRLVKLIKDEGPKGVRALIQG
ncbi:MAG: DUF520 family protein, partial [Propionibacteriaceae bacterium]|nr:DUF520 family protein [Propionibacteriaceae bacterium]